MSMDVVIIHHSRIPNIVGIKISPLYWLVKCYFWRQGRGRDEGGTLKRRQRALPDQQTHSLRHPPCFLTYSVCNRLQP